MSGFLKDSDSGLWHVPIGTEREAIWRPIRCGGGIALPTGEYSAAMVARLGGTICAECHPPPPASGGLEADRPAATSAVPD